MDIFNELKWWALSHNSAWFLHFVLHKFSDKRWIKYFCMSKIIVFGIVNELPPCRQKEDTQYRAAIALENCICCRLDKEVLSYGIYISIWIYLLLVCLLYPSWSKNLCMLWILCSRGSFCGRVVGCLNVHVHVQTSSIRKRWPQRRRWQVDTQKGEGKPHGQYFTSM